MLTCRRTNQLGDEGLCSDGTKLNSIFIITEVTFIKLKQPTLARQEKATPKKTAYAILDKEIRPGQLPRDSLIDFLLNPLAHLILKVKKVGSPEHNQGKGKKRKVQVQEKEVPDIRDEFRSENMEGSDDPLKTEFTLTKGQNPLLYQRNTNFKYHKEGPNSLGTSGYRRNKDQRSFSIFSAAAEQEEWLMPIWWKMFCQTLGGAARNWFDDLDPKSVDSFEELSQNFLEEFSQQKRYAKDPIEIYGIKRRQNEGLQALMDRFKSESSHIKGVPPVLRISAFMHGHGHPKLAKKLNDKIPKMVDKMFERV
ncbi:reverse transcriptase domain-containing protein [Tanacetum coccineum]